MFRRVIGKIILVSLTLIGFGFIFVNYINTHAEDYNINSNELYNETNTYRYSYNDETENGVIDESSFEIKNEYLKSKSNKARYDLNDKTNATNVDGIGGNGGVCGSGRSGGSGGDGGSAGFFGNNGQAGSKGISGDAGSNGYNGLDGAYQEGNGTSNIIYENAYNDTFIELAKELKIMVEQIKNSISNISV